MRTGLLGGRRRSTATVAPLLLQIVTFISLPPLSRSAIAQEPAAPTDSAPPVRCIPAAALLVVGGMLLSAPASLLLLNTTPDPADREEPIPDDMEPAFWDNHVSAYLTGGLTERFRKEPNRYGWAHSVSVEVFAHGIYGELRVERFAVPDHVQFQTVRAGYLFRPRRAVATGVTLGHRSAYGERVQDAFEIGLPLVVGAARGSARFEPTYLISSQGVSWNYRFQTELYIPRSPFMAGVGWEGKTVRQGGFYFSAFTLLVGVRM